MNKQLHGLSPSVRKKKRGKLLGIENIPFTISAIYSSTSKNLRKEYIWQIHFVSFASTWSDHYMPVFTGHGLACWVLFCQKTDCRARHCGSILPYCSQDAKVKIRVQKLTVFGISSYAGWLGHVDMGVNHLWEGEFTIIIPNHNAVQVLLLLSKCQAA